MAISQQQRANNARQAKWAEEHPEEAAALGIPVRRQLTAADVAVLDAPALSKAMDAGLLQDYFASKNISPLLTPGSAS
jgi:hypothetical protein